MDAFPLLPVEDEGGMHDPGLRENFIERVFVYRRWQEYIKEDGSLGGLVAFHSGHKYLLMAHSQKHYSALGKMVAGAKKIRRNELHTEYLSTLMEGLQHIATPKKNTNVLQHMEGYFKDKLSTDEKKELQEALTNYHDGLVPLIVPITLLKHYVRKYKEDYLARQFYLNPHPLELMLRNHVQGSHPSFCQTSTGSKIQRAFGLLERLARDTVRIDHRGPHITMTEQRLDRANVVVRLKQVRRERVSEGVGRDPFQELGTTDRSMDIPLHMRLMRI